MALNRSKAKTKVIHVGDRKLPDYVELRKQLQYASKALDAVLRELCTDRDYLLIPDDSDRLIEKYGTDGYVCYVARLLRTASRSKYEM